MIMTNLLVENVPDEFIREFWDTVSYNFFISKIKRRDMDINYWEDSEIEEMWKVSAVFSNSF